MRKLRHGVEVSQDHRVSIWIGTRCFTMVWTLHHPALSSSQNEITYIKVFGKAENIPLWVVIISVPRKVISLPAQSNLPLHLLTSELSFQTDKTFPAWTPRCKGCIKSSLVTSMDSPVADQGLPIPKEQTRRTREHKDTNVLFILCCLELTLEQFPLVLTQKSSWEKLNFPKRYAWCQWSLIPTAENSNRDSLPPRNVAYLQ